MKRPEGAFLCTVLLTFRTKRLAESYVRRANTQCVYSTYDPDRSSRGWHRVEVRIYSGELPQ